MNNKELLSIAIEASIKAGKAIIEVYESDDFGIEVKGDKSPLTKADIAADKIIRFFLARTDIPILSEEGKDIPYETRKNWDYLWIVDPIDGTKEFINKTGEFTVNIALINDRSTVFGIVAAPVSGKIWHGSVLDKQHEVDSVPETIRIVMSKSHKNENDEKFLEFLDMNNVQYQTVEKGSSLKLCSLADNEADIYSRFGPTSEWDIAAAHAVLNSCGGSVINIKEETELDYAKKSTILNPYFMAFRNKALENEFLDLLRDFFKKLV